MFEKEAYEYGKEKIDLATSMMNPQIETATRQGFKDGAEFGYEQGISRLRYCCTCKHYMRKCWDKTEPYGICADWEIKEND